MYESCKTDNAVVNVLQRIVRIDELLKSIVKFFLQRYLICVKFSAGEKPFPDNPHCRTTTLSLIKSASKENLCRPFSCNFQLKP
jgi:hypothetical protein